MNLANDPSTLRDKGLEFLQKGKEIFNSHQQNEYREKGYELYKRGLECIVKYLKMEDNPSLVNKVKGNLKSWMEEAKSMEATIFQAKNTAPPPNNTQQYAPPSNQPTNPWKPNNAPTSTPGGYQPSSGGYQPTPGGPGGYQPTPSAPKQNQPSPKNGDKEDKHGKKIKVGDDEASKMKGNLESAIVTEKPNVKWEDIAGLEQAKKSLQEAVIYPIKFPSLFVGMRTPWKGILLYGPPGTGKTYLAKACATEADATFFSVSAADVTSKYVGESEKLIKTLFSMAREKKPAIIFIDEIDSLLSARSDNENEASRRVKTEFLVQMQGVGHDDTGILVLGATNIPWALDSAVRRRFEKRIYIPLPDFSARLALLRQQLKKTPMALEEDDVQYLAERSDGYSCADMNILIRDASYQPLRKAQNATHFKVTAMNPAGKPIYVPCAPSDPQGQRMKMFDIPGDQLTLPPVVMDDFEVSLMKTKPSVSKADLGKQEEFTKSFGIEG